jgi:hypothetical protein
LLLPSLTLDVELLTCLFRLFDQLLESFADSFGVIIRIGDGGDLSLKVLKFIFVGINFFLSNFDLFFESLNLDIELFEFQCFFLIFFAFFYQLVEHVLEI